MAGDRALPGSSGAWQWLQGGTGGTHAWQWPPDHWEMLQACFSHHQHGHLSLPGQLGDTQDSLRSWGWCLWKVLVALPWGQGSREQKDMPGAHLQYLLLSPVPWLGRQRCSNLHHEPGGKEGHF